MTRTLPSLVSAAAALLHGIRRTFLFAAVVSLFLLVFPTPSQSLDITLDTTFGNGGKVTTDFAGRSDAASALAIQADGKIVVVGDSCADQFNCFAVARYNSNGTLDTSFGPDGTGRIITAFGGEDRARGVTVQPDGKIVVGGGCCSGGGPAGVAVARYNPDGSLDGGFGSGGKVTTFFPERGIQAFVNVILLQPDGKIVAAGAAGNSGFDRDHILVRYNYDGSLDMDFGTGGKVITSFEGFDEAVALALHDGKLVTAGFSGAFSGSHTRFAVARFNSNGSLDATFGTGGKVTTDFGGSGEDSASAMIIQADGKIVVSGRAAPTGTYDFALARYNSDGSLDATFGAVGKVTTDFGGSSDFGGGVGLRDGGIVVAGTTNVSGTYDFALARYNSDGSLDTTFGVAGKVTTDFGASVDFGGGMALQPDGKIVVVGSSNVDGTSDFALVRYSNGLFNFSGFFPPIDNLPTLNVVNAGSAVPVKFSLGANQGSNIFASGYPGVSGPIACDSMGQENVVTETVTAGGSSLTYDPTADKYVYTWKTSQTWAGTCRQLVIRLTDGSFHVASFKFR